MSVTTLPDQLSDAARAFAGRDQQLLIGGERVPAADGATFETLDPATGRVITTVAQAGRRGCRSRRRRRPGRVRRQRLEPCLGRRSGRG